MFSFPSLYFSGNQKMSVQPLFDTIKNTFTYEFWVKPEALHRSVTQSRKGIIGISDQQYVVAPGYPTLRGDVGIGISAAVNGVSVFEHSESHLPAVLVHKTSIKNWTHIAIVYNNKIPYLYINGELKAKGTKSARKNVFPSGVFGAHQRYGQYKGYLSEVRIWGHARTARQIITFMNKELKGSEPGLFAYWKMGKRGDYIMDFSGNRHHGYLESLTEKNNTPSQNKRPTKPSQRKVKEEKSKVLVPVNKNNNNYLLSVLKEENKLIYNFPKDVEIDIIIPVYNAFEYVKKCIKSVLDNTKFPYNLYIINDCSTDENIYKYLEELKKSTTSANLRRLNIVHNESNIGFVKSVNKGMTISKNHVIILNTDTEVPINWTNRLIAPILSENNIASVTPFSNSATICSFPSIKHDNNLPHNLTVNALDAVFARYGSYQPIELPTGHGFCMALNRKVLNQIGLFNGEIFGKGYGEENDWSQKAAKIGFKNVLIPNLFVYHKHGESFKLNDRLNRDDLRSRNAEILKKMYPDYPAQVKKFIESDPAKAIREVINSAVIARSQNKKGVMFINHSYGGGTEYYQELNIKKQKNYTRVYSIKPNKNSETLELRDFTQEEMVSYQLGVKDLTQKVFNQLIELLKIDLIYVDHLVTYPTYQYMDLIQNSGVDYVFDIHDFFSVCPSYNLINNQGVYCNAETNLDKCQSCLAGLNQISNINIRSWRGKFQSFLENASEIISPSENTKKIILKYYPNLVIRVKDREVPDTIKYTFNPQFALQKTLNIAFIGAISLVKGSEIVYQLEDAIRRMNLPINIKVIGITRKHVKEFLSADKKFHVTGRYNNSEISSLLAKHEISLVIVPSICPETYSWTTSEAMWSGYPVITFNIGAPADRVRAKNGGWILDSKNSQSILNLLIKLLSSRNEIIQKANKLKDLDVK